MGLGQPLPDGGSVDIDIFVQSSDFWFSIILF